MVYTHVIIVTVPLERDALYIIYRYVVVVITRYTTIT